MQVVNRHTHTRTPRDIYIGRGTPFGNPFPLEAGVPRASTLLAYELYLACRIRDEPLFCAQLLAIPQDAILVCSCKPRSCHGDVLLAAIEKLWGIARNADIQER